jgi:hypothetical protein
MDVDHDQEVERLWRAVKRDTFRAVEWIASVPGDPKAIERLQRNWTKLCELDLEVATALWHGIDQIGVSMARRGEQASPAAQRQRNLAEIVGLSEAGRAAKPDAEVSTVGELMKLGEDAIQAEIDRETGESA